MQKTKVLVVDDSALIRQVLADILRSDPEIEVLDTARDPYEARDKIKRLNPDVLTLDVEMPGMDGLTFLENLMRLRPMPVVMVSTFTEEGAEVTLRALELGAVDFVAKPKKTAATGLAGYAEEICAKVKVAAGARIKGFRRVRAKTFAMDVPPKHSADAVVGRAVSNSHALITQRIVAIGSSTGGTEAIREVLQGMPADAPGIVIVQHIPAAFSGSFAQRVNKQSVIQVMEAEDGQEIMPGHAYIAPGGQHLLVVRFGLRYVCRILDGPPVNRHKPSVDVLFRSVARSAGPNGVGVILTGMGDDGARGLLEMRQVGAATIAQDEQSSVVWGMPGEAVRMGAADKVVDLASVAETLLDLARRRDIRTTAHLAKGELAPD